MYGMLSAYNLNSANVLKGRTLLTNSILPFYVHTKHILFFLHQMRAKMVKCKLKYFYILYLIYFMLVFSYDQCTLAP